MKATPGPWKLRALNGRSVGRSRLHIAAEGPTSAAVAVCIARLGETVANGRILAAAPDLLDALEALLPIAERALMTLRRGPHHPDRALVAAARVAIDKARHGDTTDTDDAP